MDEYPKMLYRPGSETSIWGHDVDTRIVESEDAETVAAMEGWRLSPVFDPMDADGDGKMGGSVDRFDQMTDEQLRAEIEALGTSVHHRAGRARMLQILRDERAAA